MKYGISTLDDFDFKGKIVLARLDLNSPYDKENNRLADTIYNEIGGINNVADKRYF